MRIDTESAQVIWPSQGKLVLRDVHSVFLQSPTESEKITLAWFSCFPLFHSICTIISVLYELYLDRAEESKKTEKKSIVNAS